jgi:predicted RNA-binding protein with PUA-like domain
MNHWLLKSEPSVFSIDTFDTSPRKTTGWEGVRNYQARNMLRDEMQQGDLAFFYHSSCPEPGIAGIVEIVRTGYPDASAWDPHSEYYDPKSPENKPLWYAVDVRLVRRMKHFIPLASLREHASEALDGLLLLRKGNRLSITPLEPAHWQFILTLE